MLPAAAFCYDDVMNRGDLIRFLERSVNRPDMADGYADWINQAMRSIYRDHSFLCMRHEVTVTMESGATSVLLPDDFKELRSERSPIYMVGSDGSMLPCDVSRESTERRLLTANQTIIVPENPSTIFRNLPVWIEWGATNAELYTVYPVSGSTNFRIKYYRFLPDLTADDDKNQITMQYEEMVKAKLSAVAFEELRDPEWQDQEGLYVERRRAAIADDAYRAQKGRRTQMGS